MKIKRYALIENGQIESLYYGDTEEMRNVVREGRHYYLYHDVYRRMPNGGIMQCLVRSRIVKMADSEDELK